MPMKASGRAADFVEIDRFDGGAGWIAHPEETIQRASHVLASDGDAWVVDPVDAAGVDDLFADFGNVRGVVVLSDHHGRDAGAIADRHDAPIYVPSSVDPSVDAPTQSVSGSLPGTDFDVVRTLDWPGWNEAALFDGETLVVGDVLGTADYFVTGDERVGVHPLLRLFPPHDLRQFQPDRILTGHGEGVMADATSALQVAMDGARRRAARVWLKGLKAMV